MSNEKDVGADFLIRELRARDVNVVRLNTERSPEWKLTLEPGVRWRCSREHRVLVSDECAAVWWRRPEVPQTNAPVEAAEAVADQWRAFLAALATVPGPLWVSDPAHIRRAEGKAAQLRRARELGFDVPETLFSNDLDELKGFLERLPPSAVLKSVANAWWEDGDEGRFVFVSEVRAADLPEASRLAAAPVCVQQVIHPKRDIRVTVVGDVIFAAMRGDRPRPDDEPLDWRLAPQTDWVPCELPETVSRRCSELVRSFELRFGGIDLALADGGRHWFLELNPNGEWGWLQRAGLPIAEAMADFLLAAAEA